MQTLNFKRTKLACYTAYFTMSSIFCVPPLLFMTFHNLYNDALENELELTIFSGYRSYEKQEKIWDNNPNEYYVAKPGYSEHQTGLVVDVIVPGGDLGSFVYTDEYDWMKDNAYKKV